MNRKLSRTQLIPEERHAKALVKVECTSPEESDSETDPENYQPRTSKRCPKSCTCEEYVKIKKSSSKSVTFGKKHFWDPDELSARRQKLELMLSRTQIQESQCMERHNELQTRFDRVEAVLEALLHHIDCVKLEMDSSYRVCQLLNGLLVNERSMVVTETTSHLIRKLCDTNKFDETNAIKSKIYNALEATKEMEHLFDDYSGRKRDFNTGLLNFKILLENMNLSMKELDSLQHQFDDVLLAYQHSRCMVDQELPRLTSTKLSVLLECIAELSTDLSKIVSNRSDLASLFRSVESCLGNSSELPLRSNEVGYGTGKCRPGEQSLE